MTTATCSPALPMICDVITFEFENLPADAIAHLAEHEPVRPGASVPWRSTQDRLQRKKLCRSRWA